MENSLSLQLAKQLLGKDVEVTFDRPLGAKHPKHGFVYEANYGYIDGIKAPDGEDLDAYYLGVDIPLTKEKGTCIAIAHRKNNDDDKLVVVPKGVSMTDGEIMKAIHFQEQWFDTEIVRKQFITDTKIKAICFDLDGVFFTPKGKNSFHNALINEYGVSKEIIDELMYRSPEMAQLVRGKISTTDFWNKVREITGITATDEELTQRWVRDYEVDNDVLQAVKNAKSQGYKTCVCTNNNGIRLPVLIERYDLNSLFDVIVSSHEIGFTKPSKEIFQTLLDGLSISGQELVYSDDNPERLLGAKELGIHTFQFHNFEQYLSELNKLGIDLK
jgi:inorganic pyrophosphatase